MNTEERLRDELAEAAAANAKLLRKIEAVTKFLEGKRRKARNALVSRLAAEALEVIRDQA